MRIGGNEKSDHFRESFLLQHPPSKIPSHHQPHTIPSPSESTHACLNAENSDFDVYIMRWMRMGRQFKPNPANTTQSWKYITLHFRPFPGVPYQPTNRTSTVSMWTPLWWYRHGVLNHSQGNKVQIGHFFLWHEWMKSSRSQSLQHCHYPMFLLHGQHIPPLCTVSKLPPLHHVNIGDVSISIVADPEERSSKKWLEWQTRLGVIIRTQIFSQSLQGHHWPQ